MVSNWGNVVRESTYQWYQPNNNKLGLNVESLSYFNNCSTWIRFYALAFSGGYFWLINRSCFTLERDLDQWSYLFTVSRYTLVWCSYVIGNPRLFLRSIAPWGARCSVRWHTLRALTVHDKCATHFPVTNSLVTLDSSRNSPFRLHRLSSTLLSSDSPSPTRHLRCGNPKLPSRLPSW